MPIERQQRNTAAARRRNDDTCHQSVTEARPYCRQLSRRSYLSAYELTIEYPNIVRANAFGTSSLTLTVVGATAESLLVHCFDHGGDSFLAFGVSLR